MRVEGRLERVDAVDHLGEVGERREDARGRPPRAVGDEGARVVALEEELARAEARG
jgi:hypothetical protein